MSWQALLALIAEEVGDELAARIEERARTEMPAARIFICKRKVITPARAERAAPGKPKEAAKKLGVHYSTIYRALKKPIIR